MTLMYVWWVKIFFVDISLVISEIRNFFSGLFFHNSGIDIVIIFFFKHQLGILRVHSAGFWIEFHLLISEVTKMDYFCHFGDF